MDPDWIEALPFYEYQMWVEKLNRYIEKENKKLMEESGQNEVFNFKK
jgi:hypothetical protein